MPAPKGNRFKAGHTKPGKSFLIRVRQPADADQMTAEIINGMSPEKRWQVLAEAAGEVVSQAIRVVSDCSRCDEPITAGEPVIIWDSERVCESCYQIALSVGKKLK